MLCELLTQAARRRPLVILFDDLHWADVESLELLKYVVKKLDFSLPVMFCLVFRSLKENPALAAWQSMTNENPNCITLALSELSQADAGILLSNLLSAAELPVSFQAFIQKKTDGNPLYIEELLNTMIESGLIRSVNGQWQLTDDKQSINVPDSLYQIIQNRIDQLDFSCPGIAPPVVDCRDRRRRKQRRAALARLPVKRPYTPGLFKPDKRINECRLA